MMTNVSMQTRMQTYMDKVVRPKFVSITKNLKSQGYTRDQAASYLNSKMPMMSAKYAGNCMMFRPNDQMASTTMMNAEGMMRGFVSGVVSEVYGA